MHKYTLLIALVLSTSLLTACGGNGSSSRTSTATSQVIEVTDRVNLSWAAPTTRSDNTYLHASELAGYRVYYGTSSSNLAPLVELSDESMTEYTVEDLPAGSYYFAVSAYDTEGRESGYSQMILVHLS